MGPSAYSNVILANVGTDGDFYPFLRLGLKLRARGHRVTLASNEPHAAPASDHGFDFEPLVSTAETEARLSDPDYWHPVKGPLLASRWGVGLLDEQYATLARLAEPENSVLIASPVVFAARLVQEKLARPVAGVLLQPWGIRSVLAPPVMPGGFTLPRGMPRPIGRLYWGMIGAVVDRRLGRPLNRFRAKLGLAPVRDVAGWAFSPDRVIGMFPDWYGKPQADWPSQVRLAGFPLEDETGDAGLPDDLAAFCDAGDPPVVFTFGTGMLHARRQLEAAVDACRRLDRRGIILTRHEEQLPASLPSSVRHCSFAPFHALFPRCGAVVHHGGMGTLGQALAAGIPQLVLPLAHDQPDNAARLIRLGVGTRLGPKASGVAVAQALDGLDDTEIRSRCGELAARLAGHDSLETASGWVEELASSSTVLRRARSGR